MSGDFWKEMEEAFVEGSSIDVHLQNKKSKVARSLKVAGCDGITVNQAAGTRVRFEADLRTVLAYDNAPQHNALGTVILVKTSAGKTTSHEGRVFVLWDDGDFRPILAEHLHPAQDKSKKASNFVRRFSDLGDISGLFTASSKKADELIHKATKDLWNFRKDGELFVLERLFNDNGTPLKV